MVGRRQSRDVNLRASPLPMALVPTGLCPSELSRLHTTPNICKWTRRNDKKKQGTRFHQPAMLEFKLVEFIRAPIPREHHSVRVSFPNRIYMLQIRFIRPVCSRIIFQRYYTSGTKKNIDKRIVMANQQPPWTLPARQAEEPVLKVYNSLTRSKVCCGDLRKICLWSDCANRQSLFHGMGNMSNGTTVGPQYTMHHIWVMQGELSESSLMPVGMRWPPEIMSLRISCGG